MISDWKLLLYLTIAEDENYSTLKWFLERCRSTVEYRKVKVSEASNSLVLCIFQ